MWICLFIALSLGLSATFAESVDCSKHPPKMAWKGCCDKPNLMKKVEKAEKCLELIPEVNAVEKRGPHHASCFMECVLNDTGVIENGDINVEEAKKYLTTILDDEPEFLQITIDSLESCIEFAKMKIKEHLPAAAGHCDHLPVSVAACLGSAIFVNCPEDKWHESDECNQNREFLKACKM